MGTEQINREFQVFVKPVGARCNLTCDYCYYLEKKILYPGQKNILMPEDVLESYIEQHMEASRDPVITFSWHGGEPTLAGIGFFRRAVGIQKRLQPPGTRIVNGIQTNGTLLDDEWGRFLAEEGFVVGISMDGPPALNDVFRHTRGKKPVSGRVLEGYRTLQDYGVLTEILCVVHAVNANHPLEVYRFFRDIGARFLTFLPLVERLPGPVPLVSKRSVPAATFGRFLVSVFDEWVKRDIGKVKIQIFEEAIRPAFQQDHSLCIFRETCGLVPVIEYNGDFYCCDHYVAPPWKLGNITRDKLWQLLSDPRQLSFGKAKQDNLPLYCRECGVLNMCNGGCPKNRFLRTPDGEVGLNYLCEGYKLFFLHCKPFVEAVSMQWKGQGD